VDQDKIISIYIWKDYGFRPDYSILDLVCMSLIKITDHNKFWMHDQLRDLGRKIVRGEQSRLWVLEMANNIIGTKEVKAYVRPLNSMFFSKIHLLIRSPFLKRWGGGRMKTFFIYTDATLPLNGRERRPLKQFAYVNQHEFIRAKSFQGFQT